MLGQCLYLGERKQEGSRRYKAEKVRELRGEQRCSWKSRKNDLFKDFGGIFWLTNGSELE